MKAEEIKPLMGFFEKLGEGLRKTRNAVFGTISQMLDAGEITPELYEDLEEQLILADTGADVAMDLVEELRLRVRDNRLKTGAEAMDALKDILREKLTPDTEFDTSGHPTVILVIGVNGVGKTTSIAKLAHLYTQQGKKVMLAAGDTFRAAAGEQLEIWANRAGVPMVRHQDGADPASVVFDAVQSATARGYDIVLCDTAGRLHNKKHLMEELRKMHRVIEREYPQATLRTMLVIDATTGQNGLVQAREFCEVTPVSGIVLTKLDGTAKGGIAVAIQNELKLPVMYVGVGEAIEDLQAFDADAFVDAIF